ncbi:Gamma-tubulin complex component [Arachis hypogaea]|nr:Gamma-tubulin complex component [Arachis hypogaea]
MREILASSSTVCKIRSLCSTVRFCVIVESTPWLPIHPPLIVVEEEEEEEDLYFDAMEEEEDFFDEMDENNHADGGVAGDDALDEYEILTKVTDTSAAQARKKKDIQGIQWDRLNISRDSCRVTRLEQYKNYENIPTSGDAINEDCKRSVKGGKYYDFFYNTIMVKPTILHFQCFLEESHQLMRLPPRQSIAEADLMVPFQLMYQAQTLQQMEALVIEYSVDWPLHLFFTQEVLSK